MAIPVLPLTLVTSLERRLVTSVAEARSPFTGTSQIQDWGASWWEYQIEMAVTQGAKARRLSAFFTALGGLRGRFLFPDPSIEVPLAAGNPYVTEAQVPTRPCAMWMILQPAPRWRKDCPPPPAPRSRDRGRGTDPALHQGP